MNEILKKYADLIVQYSQQVKPGELIMIDSTYQAKPLVAELFRSIIQAGGNPYWRIQDNDIDWIRFNYGSKEQIGFIKPGDNVEAETIDGSIHIICDENLQRFSNISTDKIAEKEKAKKKVHAIMDKREIEGKYRWSLCAYPTQGMAQQAKMSLYEYSDFIFSSCMLNDADPVASWKKFESEQQCIVDYLSTVNELHYKGEGVDLKLSVKGRIWQKSVGRLNMPDGEVYTGPVEDSAEGWILFDFPAIYRGNEVLNARIEFSKGKAVKATAERGEEFLRSMIAMDDGSAFLGEAAFGLNNNIQKFSGSILFDEKIGGTIHLALGNSYLNTGGKNVSALHWDLIKGMKNAEVYADGKLAYKGGKFVF